MFKYSAILPLVILVGAVAPIPAFAAPAPAADARLGPLARRSPVTPARAAPVDPRACLTHYRRRQYRAARRCFRVLLRASGPDPQLLYAVGYSSYQLKEYRDALGIFAHVLRLRPKDGDAMFMTGMALAQLGQHRRAIRFFERALAIGLGIESPKEARRHLKTLRKLLASRLRSGWLIAARIGVGYDTHPRLGGSASVASTSDGSSGEGSGFSRLELRIGHRWLRVLSQRPSLRFAATLSYRFDQLLVFSDLVRSTTTRFGWRGAEAVGGLSLQTHEAQTTLRLLGRRFDAGLRIGTQAELSGLRDMRPLSAGLSLEGDVLVHWHSLTHTTFAAGFVPQWALDSSMGYLTGRGVTGTLTQTLRWRRLRVALSYRFGAWWLGILETPISECQAGEPCGLSVPFSNHMHRVRLRIRVRATRWLSFDASAGVEHRTFWGVGEYRLPAGDIEPHQRVDVTQRYWLSARFLVAPKLRLMVTYGFAQCHSTISAETVGIEEGYDRHQISAGISYLSW